MDGGVWLLLFSGELLVMNCWSSGMDVCQFRSWFWTAAVR